MTADSASARRFGRLGWATPALAVGVTAVTLGILVGPTLGTQVRLPHHIVLSEPAPSAATTPRPTAAPRPSTAASPSSTPIVRVVPPARPVVTAATDDAHDDGARDVGGGDG